MRWEDVVRKDVDALDGGLDCKERASDRDGWRDGCFTEWSYSGRISEKIEEEKKKLSFLNYMGRYIIFKEMYISGLKNSGGMRIVDEKSEWISSPPLPTSTVGYNIIIYDLII